MPKYSNNGNCKFNISYHIVWIPKYRKRILINKIEDRLKELIKYKTLQLGIYIGAIECMPDHIHLFIKSKPTLSISNIVKTLKGYSSRMLRIEFIQCNKYKCLWTLGYFCETIGNITGATIIKYIENQKLV